jgi:hypothetical protein
MIGRLALVDLVARRASAARRSRPARPGRFENGAGVFYGDTTIDGAPTRVRFIWSGIASASPRWEQAYSSDAGKTWDTNWIMEFRRVP